MKKLWLKIRNFFRFGGPKMISREEMANKLKDMKERIRLANSRKK